MVNSVGAQGDMNGFRHELKYQITSEQLHMLHSQLPDLMDLDPSVGSAGSYRIRSLYFDDYGDTCYFENENGTEPREKFRIRIYNGTSDLIRLELKRKERGMTRKRSCRLSREMAISMIQGLPIPWSNEMDPLMKKFYIQQETRLLQPKIIVEYDRIPYVAPEGNVRITLDLNVSSSRELESFFDSEIAERPIMPPNTHLLEVKYDQFLPEYIYRSFQNKRLSQITYSKYYLCRKFVELI